MSGNTDSVIVRASMSALEYNEAAWQAHDLETAPPDPSGLSDHALRAILSYEMSDIPAEALKAVRTERRRRDRPWKAVEDVLGLAVLAMLAISGIIIAWFLLVP